MKKYLLFFLVVVFFLPLVVLAAYHLAFIDRVYPGVYVAGFPLDNMTKNEAEQLLGQYMTQKALPILYLTYGEKSWQIILSDVGVSPQIKTTVQEVFSVGRRGTIFEQMVEKWESFSQGIKIPVAYSSPNKNYEDKLALISTNVSVPLVEPAINILDNLPPGSPGRITVTAGSPGKTLDTEALKREINLHLVNLDSSPIFLPVVEIPVTVSTSDIERTKVRAEVLIDRSIILTSQDFSQELSGKALISLIHFKNGFDEEKTRNYVSNLAKSVDRKPTEAAFSFENGRVTVFRPSKEGLAIKIEEASLGLTQELAALEATYSSRVSYALPTIKTEPSITTESVNTLGIKELLGRGQSNFKGSIAGRVHNIVLASSKLNGLLIKPGETFSFNKALGDVSANTGYQQAYIIKEGRTILGDGGGVCQVSTTLFRAVLAAGLPIEERWAHSYRVSYYEQGYPPGLDATVYDPGYDLKFKNDTPGHILIQTRADTNNMILTFELYGTSDGRKAETSKPRVWSETPPPPDLYQDDPTLPVGQVKQVDWKAWGAKVSFDYKVTRNGETLIEKTFYSNYLPWQSVFLKGTKT